MIKSRRKKTPKHEGLPRPTFVPRRLVQRPDGTLTTPEQIERERQKKP